LGEDMKLVDAAKTARSLLSRLSSRLEITDELADEISRAEEQLWVALERIAGEPNRVTARACEDCPFARFDEGRCEADDDKSRPLPALPPQADFRRPPPPPDWCPLRRGDIVVSLAPPHEEPRT